MFTSVFSWVKIRVCFIYEVAHQCSNFCINSVSTNLHTVSMTFPTDDWVFTFRTSDDEECLNSIDALLPSSESTIHRHWLFVQVIYHHIDGGNVSAIRNKCPIVFSSFLRLVTLWYSTFSIIRFVNNCPDTFFRNSKSRCGIMLFNTSCHCV